MRTHVDNIGDVAVVECEGRMASREDTLRLQTAVRSNEESRIVVVDLTEVEDIEICGLEMLQLSQNWALNHGIQLKLFNPMGRVRRRLEQARARSAFEIATLDELIGLICSSEILALAS